MSLLLTRVQDVVTNNPNLYKWENRLNLLGAFDAFKRQSEQGGGVLTTALKEQIRAAAGKTVKTPVINNKGVTIRSTRPLVIPIDENTSTFVTFTKTTLAYGFHIYPNRHHNNYVSMQEEFEAQFKAMMVGFSDSIEALCVTKLDAAKTQVISGATTPGNHTFAANVVSETGIGDLKNSYILHDLIPMFRMMKMHGVKGQMDVSEIDVVGNPYFESIVRRQEGFGVFNQENKTLPMGNKMFHWSKDITNAAGKDATGFAIANGSLGLMTSVERPSLYGSSTSDGHKWGTVRLPWLDIEVGTYEYNGAVDAATAIGGADVADMTRDIVQVYDFAFDLWLVTPYNSAPSTIPSPIIKFNIARA